MFVDELRKLELRGPAEEVQRTPAGSELISVLSALEALAAGTYLFATRLPNAVSAAEELFRDPLSKGAAHQLSRAAIDAAGRGGSSAVDALRLADAAARVSGLQRAVDALARVVRAGQLLPLT